MSAEDNTYNNTSWMLRNTSELVQLKANVSKICRFLTNDIFETSTSFLIVFLKCLYYSVPSRCTKLIHLRGPMENQLSQM